MSKEYKLQKTINEFQDIFCANFKQLCLAWEAAQTYKSK